jgi:hypothetical protein
MVYSGANDCGDPDGEYAEREETAQAAAAKL